MKTNTRALIIGSAMLLGISTLTGSAQALTVEEVAAQYSGLGYQITEIKLEDNGVIKIEAIYDGVRVEFSVDAATGEVVAIDDSAASASGSASASDSSGPEEPEDSDDFDDSDDSDDSDHDSGSGSGSKD